MKRFNKMITIILISVMMIVILVSNNYNFTNASSRVVEGEPVKVEVLLYKFDDYISLVVQNLEEIEKENKGKIEFNFWDGKGNQAIQKKSIDNILQKKDVDLILLDLVDIGSAQEVINRIKEYNIPVILFHREPIKADAIKSYGKALYIGTDSKEAGILQGKILVDEWNTNKAIIDKNRDNIMEYIMLMGEENNLDAIERTNYSVLTINNEGIKTQKLASQICNWNEEEAKNVTKDLLLSYGNKIEVIISNNDSMAIGAVKALQEQGYNNGDKIKTIPVVGVDGIIAAQELIKQGFMAGTVIQDAPAVAKALYIIGMNLVYDKNPIEGTEYKFDDTGVAIRIPYKEYINK